MWLQKQMEDKIAEMRVEQDKALSDRDELWEHKWKDRVQQPSYIFMFYMYIYNFYILMSVLI